MWIVGGHDILTREMLEMKAHLALVVCAVSVALIGLELVARGAYAFLEQQSIRHAEVSRGLWAVYDPILGYRLNPEFEDINALGLRDRPVAPKGKRFRVLMLGDSLGYYGDTIDDTYVRRAASLLEADPMISSLDVVNASVRGYTTYQELLYLKHDGVSLEPDLVGVGFVLNDLHRFLHTYRVRNGQIVDHRAYGFSTEAIESVQPRSVLLQYLTNTFRITRGTWRWWSGDRFDFESRIDFNTAWRDESWRETAELLREMKELGEEYGFGLFVTVFPIASQYNADYLAKDRAYVLKPQRTLASICEKLGVPYLDLYPLLSPEQHLGEDGLHLTGAQRLRHTSRLPF